MSRKPLTNEDGKVRALTAEDFQDMQPAATALPGLLGEGLAAQLLQHRPGRGPQKAPTKAQVTLRLDPDLIQHFKQTGAGWQTRLNDTLRKAIGL